MSDWPTPTRADHAKFCEKEGWRQIRDSRGRTGTHHLTYELDLADGRMLRARISHPPDRTDYGPSMWSHILRDQLAVSEAEFWACVRGADKPARGLPPRPSEGLPAELVYLLIHRVAISESEVASMSKELAIERLNAYWSAGG